MPISDFGYSMTAHFLTIPPEDYYTNINNDLMEAFEKLNDDFVGTEQLIENIISFIKFFKSEKYNSV